MYQVFKIEEQHWEAYNEFLKGVPEAMLYYSKPYHDLLKQHLGAETQFLAVASNTKIVAVLPMMFSKPGKFGKVANSMPYYGSNGSILFSTDLKESEMEEVGHTLLSAAVKLIQENDCAVYTFIDNPLYKKGQELMRKFFSFEPGDFRIGQITALPAYSEEGYDETLTKIFENPRPRNIRKALKSGVEVYASNSSEDVEFLFQVHQDNIQAIGGISKSKSFFDDLQQRVPEDMWKVYVATKDGERIAALLLFYFNETVEYFTPATIHDFRNLQPSALLIFEAMKEAAKNGYKNWNWGGTWRTQTGVYDFKRKWGASDNEYFYYTEVLNEAVLNASPKTLLEEYPYFYVLSFSQLKANE